MDIILNNSNINGFLNIPASKSYMQRFLAASLLASGISIIEDPVFCADSKNLLDVIKTLGANIAFKDNKLFINGSKNVCAESLFFGESALATRLMCPIVAVFNNNIILKGDKSLAIRPMNMIKKPLEDLGGNVELNNIFPPIHITGRITGGKATVDGQITSQFLSGLLMALPLTSSDSVLKVIKLKSKPYVDITIDVLTKFGISIVNDNYKIFHIKGRQKYKPTTLKVEGDWSSAAFFIVAAAISGRIELGGLNFSSKQADKEVLRVIERFGAKIIKTPTSLIVEKNKNNSFTFDANDCPDLFPPLAVLATAANGTSSIYGVKRLIHKESNRALTIQKEFAKLNIDIKINGDEMQIKGTTPKGGKVQSNNDHRIAMALGVLSLICSGEVTISDADSVKKSYPDFFSNFKPLTN